MTDRTLKIAFVDTGNTGRSVTAEALANVIIREKGLPVAVISRGVDMNPFFIGPEPHAATLLMQRGIDVSGHLAAPLTANDVRHADLVITLTEKHKATIVAQFPEATPKTFMISEYATGQAADVPDAFGQEMPAYEEMVRQVSAYVPLVLEKALKAG